MANSRPKHMKQADVERWYTRKKIPFFARIRKQEPQTSEEPPKPSESQEPQQSPATNTDML